MNFIELGLSEPILDGLRDVGFSSPTKIQEESIIPIVSGRDIIASSETGTGKTGAFVIPILEKLHSTPSHGVKCLILTPTRELANQIDQQITIIGYYSGVTSATVFGGTDGAEFGVQERALRTDGANIIIATPGRLLDHIKMGHVDFSQVSYLVLDEADRMLDMGFMPDVKKIVGELPTERQNILFSATIPDTLNHFFKDITNDAVRVDCSVARTAENVKQMFYKVTDNTRESVLVSLVSKEEVSSAIVFTRTKRDADVLFKKLMKSKVLAGVIHGDREQDEREVTLEEFKSGKIKVLVATDVLARGIDVDDVSHVFNFQVPEEPEDYVHRIGRTGRADALGTAITLVSPRELKSYDRIRKHVKTPIEEIIPEGVDQSEIEEAFSSPSSSKGSRKAPSRKPVSKKSEHHHTLETSSDVASAAALGDSNDSKNFIRTSTTNRKASANSAVDDTEKVKPKATVRKKGEQKTSTTQPKKLIKRHELEKMAKEEEKASGFIGKLKRFFGIGK